MILTPQSEALYNELEQALDETKQVQIIRQLVDLIHQEHAAAPLALVPGTWAARPGIGSWKALPTPGVGVFLETLTQR